MLALASSRYKDGLDMEMYNVIPPELIIGEDDEWQHGKKNKE